MTVTVVIPWRDTDGERAQALASVRIHLHQALPTADVVLADTDHQPFNRAAARNAGVRQAEQAGADIVVVCDADTVPQPGPLTDAIDGARTDGLLHYPFREFHGLSLAGTKHHRVGVPLDRCAIELHSLGSLGGVLVLRPDTWFAAGGMDERFTGWGFEDVAFAVAMRTLIGDEVRHDGNIYHLWHASEIDFEAPTYKANLALCEEYIAANGNADEIRKLVSGRDRVEAVR